MTKKPKPAAYIANRVDAFCPHCDYLIPYGAYEDEEPWLVYKLNDQVVTCFSCKKEVTMAKTGKVALTYG